MSYWLVPGEADAMLRRLCLKTALSYNPLQLGENAVRQTWFSEVSQIPGLPRGEFSSPLQ